MEQLTLALLILLFSTVFYNKSAHLLSAPILIPMKSFLDEHGKLVLYLVLFIIFIILYASMNNHSFKDKKGEKWIREIGSIKV
jgi:hypothetical protein